MLHRLYSVVVILLFGHSAIAYAAEPFVLKGENSAPRQPQLTVDRTNRVHLVFGSGSRIYHCFSLDGGETFADAVAVGGARFLSLGMRRGPRVAVAQDAVVVTAIGGELGGGRDGDLFAWRSTDKGKSWQGPTRVNDVDASAREGLHAMAASPKGLLYCAWLDLRNKRTEIIGAASPDGGKTWSENHLVYRSPDGSVCECCHPSVTFSPHGALLVMWRNSLAGNRDMYFAKSDDNGRTFRTAQHLGAGHWQLAACPMDGGAIAVDESGVIHTVWRRQKAVYATNRDPAGETRLGDGEQPWLAITEHGPAIAWIDRRPGDLLIKLPTAKLPAKLGTQSRDPVIIATKGGVVIGWETEQDGRPLIMVQRIDGGSI